MKHQSLLVIHHGIQLEKTSKKTMPQLSQLAPVAANLTGEFPAQFCLSCKNERALETVSIWHLDSPVLCGLGKDNAGCWPA